MINDKATPEERQESRLLTHMRESLANLTSKIETLTTENKTLTTEKETLANENETLANENETLTTEKETLANENETFSRGIQDVLDNNSDDLPDNVKSSLQKLLFKKSINH